MRKIRRGVFETNSSSTHSITLSNDSVIKDRIHINDNNECIIYTGKFGWEVESYNDSATKASYALTYAANIGNPEKRYELLEMLKESIKMEVGIDVSVIFDIDTESNEYFANGYIDHQSFDVAEDVFFDVETLHKFIFDRNSVLNTDNDNHYY
jgi:hypothetical protein